MDNKKIGMIIALIIWGITGVINLVFRKNITKIDYLIIYVLLIYLIILRIVGIM